MSEKTLIIRGESGAGILASIERADLADSTKKKYSGVMKGYLDTGGDPYDAGQLAAYADGLSASQKAFLSAVVTTYTKAMVSYAKSVATPDNVDNIQATIWRAEALQDAVQPEKSKGGQKTHTWLSQAQVKELLDTCDDDLIGRRDRLALGLMVAAGLRRAEAVTLTFSDVKLQPVRGKIRAVLAIEGKGGPKGGKSRTVPVSDALAAAIDAWSVVVGGEGRILRSLNQRKELRDDMSAVALFYIVQAHGAGIGKPELAPHDLRRTYAQLGHEAGIPITQISKLLGHASIATTQRYLNLELNLETTVSDFIPF